MKIKFRKLLFCILPVAASADYLAGGQRFGGVKLEYRL